MANPSNKVRKEVYRRDGFRCALCDRTNGLQIHHVIRRSQGGSNHECNLITLCHQCHALAHGMGNYELAKEHTPETMELDCIVYLADYYAEQGIYISDYNRN